MTFGFATWKLVVKVRAALNRLDRSSALLLPHEESIAGYLGILYDVASKHHSILVYIATNPVNNSALTGILASSQSGGLSARLNRAISDLMTPLLAAKPAPINKWVIRGLKTLEVFERPVLPSKHESGDSSAS